MRTGSLVSWTAGELVMVGLEIIAGLTVKGRGKAGHCEVVI